MKEIKSHEFNLKYLQDDMNVQLTCSNQSFGPRTITLDNAFLVKTFLDLVLNRVFYPKILSV